MAERSAARSGTVAWPRAVAALALCALAGCSSAARSTGQGATGTLTLSVVGTNDLHGALLQNEGRGGLALLGGYLKNLRAERERDGGAVLLVDAGDMWQGTMESNATEGAAAVDAYDALGYDAAAIGNHEFDFGPVGPSARAELPGDDPRGALKARAAEAGFPFLAANLVDEATGRPVEWPNVQPSVLIEIGGVRIGLIGVTTMATLGSTMSAHVAGLALAPVAPSIQREATGLRAAGATVIVVAAHAGGACQAFGPGSLASCDSSAEIFEVARELPPGLVDVIVAGHTHNGIAHEVAGIAIVESFSRGQAFGRVDLTIDRATGRALTRSIHGPQYVCAFHDAASRRCAPAGARGAAIVPAEYAGAVVVPDPAVEAILLAAAEQIEAFKNLPLGVAAETRIPIAGAVESPLGNLFTDTLLAAVPGADVAVNNTRGGLRANLPAGPVTYGRLFEVFPFDNRLARLELTGADLKRVFAGELQRSGRMLGVAGLRVLPACAAGRLDVRLVRPTGAGVRDADRLVVATTDFLATGALFRPVAPRGGFEILPGAPVVRDLVAEELRRRGGTLRAADLVNDEAPRWPAESTLPVRCSGS